MKPWREEIALARVGFSMAKKSLMEERRTEPQHATYGASHNQEQHGGYFIEKRPRRDAQHRRRATNAEEGGENER